MLYVLVFVLGLALGLWLETPKNRKVLKKADEKIKESEVRINNMREQRNQLVRSRKRMK